MSEPVQWRNRRGGGGVETSDREIFADISRKKEARKKKGKEVKLRREKEKWKIVNRSRKVIKRGEDFFFFFFLFSFLLLKTTKICFGSTKMGIFYRE